MLERYAFSKTCNHFDFGCAACGWCPRGTCDAIEPEHVAIRFAGCGYNTCKLTSNLYIFHLLYVQWASISLVREMETPSTVAIQKAEEAGKLNKRQGRALRRLSERVSEATIEHMLGLMGHVTLAKASKDATEKGIV